MNLKVHNPTTSPDDTVYLKLEQRGNYVWVVACDATGKKISSGNLIEISPDGVRLANYVNSALPFPRDENDAIKVIG